MTIVEWLKLNPRHRVTLSADEGCVKASLYGGEGVDQKLGGKGDDEQQAIQKALEARQAIKSAPP